MDWLIFFFNLLLPIIMIIAGRLMFKHTQENISQVFGYRTPRSMKNKETWKFANQYCGKLWWKIGWVLLIMSFVGQMIVFKRYDADTTCAVLCTVQCVIIVLSIIPVELALRKNFNNDGSRK